MKKPSYVKDSVWTKASPDAQRIIEGYKKWWDLMCNIANEQWWVINHVLFETDDGKQSRPNEWIEATTFKELVRLARMQEAD
ncbi:MAG TPA: hypothetical protein VMY59_08070 [Candidatus Thermoplasmatota archaeon]|nr:hypothetical protein [Candidatus Thermoplasmatota archaeon]